MKLFKFILIIVLILQGCVVQFVPEAEDFKDYITVDALVTDQNSSYKIEVTRTSPLGQNFTKIPVTGSLVSISDDLGNMYQFTETTEGLYVSDSLSFRGEVGRKYTLHIKADGHQFESLPVEMNPVPPIDSLYADIIDNNTYQLGKTVQGYQVYVSTHDPANKCKFYRWNFAETWEFRLPWIFATIVNTTCWKSASSNNIYIQNTSSLTENKVTGFPLNFITTETDRLQVKYSLFLRQYSLSEDEYVYWDKLKRITEEVGGLYDVVPMSIESNIFIHNTLTGFPDFYKYCPFDTIPIGIPIPNLDLSVFILEELNPVFTTGQGFRYVLTYYKECVDCTLSGTNKMPDYWNMTKNDVVIQSAIK
jgi:hypothetical protein